MQIRSLLGCLLFCAGILAFQPAIHAATVGTTAGNAALAFDPFSPNVAVSRTATSSASPISSSGATSIVVVPPTIPVARTPGDVPTVYISINDAPTVIQSSTSNTLATFTITLSGTIGTTVTVDYTTADGTAVAGTDYVATSGTITFPPFTTTAFLTVTVLPGTGNTLKTFYVNLSNAQGVAVSTAVVQIARAQGLGTIQPSVLDLNIANSPTVIQSTTAITHATFPVTLSSPATTTVTVNFATSNGTAIQNLDYVATSGTVTFAPGVTSQTITVDVLPESKSSNETFYCTLSSPSGAPGVTIQNAVGSAEIRGQNSEVFVTGSTAPNPVTGTSNIYALVSLDKASTQTITVKLTTADGTAKNNIDYHAVSTTVTFTAGQTVKSVAIPLIGIAATIPDRTFTVNLSAVTGNGFIEGPTATMTITGHTGVPQPPTFSINNVTVTAGSTITHAVFTVTRSGALTGTSSVHFATANNSALAPTDYLAQSGTLNFAVGQSTTTISVTVNAQTTHQATKDFDVNLTSPVGATITDSQGIGTIVSGIAGLSINSVSITAPTTGHSNMVFTVTRSGSTTGTATVHFATANNTAIAGTDYVATSGTLTFASGVSTQTITVVINAETMYEPSKNFKVNLSSATNASITTGTGIGTIYTPYTLPKLSVSGFTGSEGTSGTKPFVFDVTLNVGSSQTITVAYSTANGTATTPTNYAATSGTLTFTSGQTVKTITVNVKGGSVANPPAVFYMKLSNPVNATIAVGTGTGTITK